MKGHNIIWDTNRDKDTEIQSETETNIFSCAELKRERQRETDRPWQRQKYRKRQPNRQKEIQKDRKTERDRETETDALYRPVR